MDQFTLIQKIAIWILPILFAVTLHEAAHGYIAFKLGDDTAYRLGRVTANPLKHIDIIGTIIVPVVLMITSGFIFGWAKPVPVNPSRLRKPKRDFALVALAGPLSNFAMAVIWMFFLKLGILLKSHQFAIPLAYMGLAGVWINLILMVLNLIPIPPLDGSRVFTYFLPHPWDRRFNQITPFGIVIILILILTGILSMVMLPAVQFLQVGLFSLFSIRGM